MISDHLDRLSLMKNESMNTPEQFEKSMFVFGTIHKIFVEAVEKCGLPEIAQKISQWDPNALMGVFLLVAEPMRSGLKVLNHGDDWVNNILFKKDETGKTIDAKFIDFQLSFWGSPANDLIYFLISSVQDEIKTTHFDDLIVHYHEELCASLKSLNYEKHIPTLAELHVDLLDKGAECKNL